MRTGTHPGLKGARLRGVDVARAVALIGMMGTHLLPELDAQGRVTPWFWFAGGRASALFAVLAGVSLALSTGGRTPRLRPARAVVVRVVVRSAAIAVVGLALVQLDPPIAVILVNYALLFVLGLPLLWLRPALLLAGGAAWALVMPLVSQSWRLNLPPGPGPQPAFHDVLDQPLDLLTRLTLTGYYPVLTWLAYLAVGVAVGRMSLRRKRTAWTLTITGAGLAVAAMLVSRWLLDVAGWQRLVVAGPQQVVLPSLGAGQLELRGLYGTTPTTSWWWQVVASAHSGTTLDLVGAIGSALLVLGLALLVCDRRLGRLGDGVVGALAATGSMTLTLYTVHVVAADAQQHVVHRGMLLATHVAVAVLLAVLWRRSFARGPMEQVVHTLSTAAAAGFGRVRA
ncbi:heparan-alpha-glucosaminide N-acetyltransferase domain-containing protein [Angustibacter sp. McL0619]|uniref:heparan-alpha-glucosaminide N-acetyltransferase domain-containing protein n=1 Tax=Angustibacter sp. McL0619 TaxID=3415676 RepID=UPI003CF30112